MDLKDYLMGQIIFLVSYMVLEMTLGGLPGIAPVEDPDVHTLPSGQTSAAASTPTIAETALAATGNSSLGHRCTA